MTSRKKIIVVTAGIVLIYLAAALFMFYQHLLATKTNASALAESNSQGEKKQQWAILIDTLGAEQAYEMFAKETGQITDIGKQHGYAHTMGLLLYEKLGNKGIAICDPSFTFGCYHSFIGKSIAENGVTVADPLYKECLKLRNSSGGCIHGVGHGVMYAFGKEKLIDALDICGVLTGNTESSICTSGVFMEYNMNTMNNPTGDRKAMRPFLGDYYAPCPTIPVPYRKACYFGLPHWWYFIRKSSNDLGNMPQLCDDIKKTDEKTACFLGIGDILPSLVAFNPDRATTLCQQMPTRHAEILCRAAALHGFLSVPGSPPQADSLCKNLSSDETIFCNEKVNMLKLHLL